MARVVVTGIGAVTPLGASFRRSWDSLKAGRSGIREITKFDASSLPWKVAGEVTAFDPGPCCSPKEVKLFDPFVHYAVAAAVMAAHDARLLPSSVIPGHQPHEAAALGLVPAGPLTSSAVLIGSSRGGISTLEQAIVKGHSMNPGLETRNFRLSPHMMPSSTIGMAASAVAQRLRMQGSCLGISTACASGAHAIGEAYRMIKSGYASIALAGGTEAPICRTCIAGYGTAGALSRYSPPSTGSPGTPRPLDRTRDGFVLSEGACILVLEEYRHALERNAPVYGEVIGYGSTSDGFHMTRPDPRGEARAIGAAIENAGITRERVDYVTVHATGTKIGDKAEAEALHIVFGARASRIPVTAVKSTTGHMLAASGPFEAASALMTIHEGVIPPTLHLDEKDLACNLNAAAFSRREDVSIAVSNSFGFGGMNAVLVCRKVS